MNKENIKFEILDLVGTVVHIAIDKEYDGYVTKNNMGQSDIEMV